MADGRMLKKVICESPRLAALKNDTHRLIYTWLIPHLDIEGRHSADPRVVKSHVAPILDHITHKIIVAALNDMAVHSLIILYEADGKKCLELCKFKKHQNLREDRERPSDIPALTPGVVRELSGSTPKQDKIREDNISKAKGRPVDNSPLPLPDDDEPKPEPEAPGRKEASVKKDEKHPPSQNTHGERWTPKQNAEFEVLMADIRSRLKAFPFQQVYLFTSANSNRANPDAMLHVLRSYIRQLLAGEKIARPKEWLEAGLMGSNKTGKAGENGKYEAAVFDHEQQALKKADFGAVLDRVRASPGG